MPPLLNGVQRHTAFAAKRDGINENLLPRECALIPSFRPTTSSHQLLYYYWAGTGAAATTLVFGISVLALVRQDG